MNSVSPDVIRFRPLVVDAGCQGCLIRTFHVAGLVRVSRLAPERRVQSNARQVVTFGTVNAVHLCFATGRAIKVLLNMGIIRHVLREGRADAVANGRRGREKVPRGSVAVVDYVRVT